MKLRDRPEEGGAPRNDHLLAAIEEIRGLTSWIWQFEEKALLWQMVDEDWNERLQAMFEEQMQEKSFSRRSLWRKEGTYEGKAPGSWTRYEIEMLLLAPPANLP